MIVLLHAAADGGAHDALLLLAVGVPWTVVLTGAVALWRRLWEAK